MPEMKLDMKTIGAGLTAIGIGAGVMAGYFTITTPEAQKCAVDLADAKARLELHAEVVDACKTALQACSKGTP